MTVSNFPSSYSSIKLTRPQLITVYPRVRLFEMLSEIVPYGAVWICGPAGCGKTTLANSFIKSLNQHCIWYNVDEQDRDISSFFYFMRQAAEQLNPEQYRKLPFLTQEFFPGIAAFSIRFLSCFPIFYLPDVLLFWTIIRKSVTTPCFMKWCAAPSARSKSRSRFSY